MFVHTSSILFFYLLSIIHLIFNKVFPRSQFQSISSPIIGRTILLFLTRIKSWKARKRITIRITIQWRAICLINIYYRVVLHLWELYLCLLLVLIALFQIADMYIVCKSMCSCNLLNCIPNPYNYISLIDIIYIVYAWNRWSWKGRWFSCNKWTKFIIILINRKFNDDYRYLILILKYTRYFDIF